MPVMGKAVCTNCSPQLVYVIGPLCSILLQSTHQKICKGIAHSTRDCYQCIITPPLPQGLNISSRAIGELRSCSPAFVRQESSCRGGDRSGGVTERPRFSFVLSFVRAPSAIPLRLNILFCRIPVRPDARSCRRAPQPCVRARKLN